MEELKKLLQAYIGGEDDFFRSLVMGSDPNTFAVNIDEVEETPAVGCLVSRRATADVVGKPCYEFSLFFVIKRLEDATAEEWDFAQQELITEMHCFLNRIRPALWRYPQNFNHWSDHALSGYWCDLTASAVSVSECVSCLPPTPPDPRMGYYEYLEAVSGNNNYNVWVFTNIVDFEGCEFTITFQQSSSNSIAFVFRVGAFNTTPPNLLYNVKNRAVIDYVNRALTIYDTDGEEVYSAAINVGRGTETIYNGFWQLLSNRGDSNVRTVRVWGVEIRRDGTLIYDMRPYVDRNGVVGLKDVITGDFFTPQQNVSIEAVNKLDENGRALPSDDAKKKATEEEATDYEEKSTEEEDISDEPIDPDAPQEK